MAKTAKKATETQAATANKHLITAIRVTAEAARADARAGFAQDSRAFATVIAELLDLAEMEQRSEQQMLLDAARKIADRTVHVNHGTPRCAWGSKELDRNARAFREIRDLMIELEERA
jgi:hypothetical protein